MISFFDSSIDKLAPFIDKLWASSSKNSSLYIRGSALLPIKSNLGKPIDIDFLLFTHDDTKIIREEALEISNEAYKAFPAIPHLDIKVVCSRVDTTELLYCTLLVTKTGQLLYGEDLSYFESLYKNKQRDIILFALFEAESKLNSVIQTSNKNIQKKRIPHLSKAILRIAGLLSLKDDSYTRSPQDCANILYKKYPNLVENITIILNSFREAFLSDELLMSYFIVLNEVKRDVESD